MLKIGIGIGCGVAGFLIGGLVGYAEGAMTGMAATVMRLVSNKDSKELLDNAHDAYLQYEERKGA